MSRLPKLKVRSLDRTDIYDLAEAKEHLSYGYENVVLVDGRVVSSNEELAKLVTQEKYKNQKFIEVTLLPFVDGG